MASELVWHLQQHARTRPDEPAVIQIEPSGEQAVLTWAGLLGASCALAERLRQTTPQHAVVMLALCNRSAFHIAFLGGLLAERRVFPFNPESAPPEFADAIERTGVTTVVGEPGLIAQPAFAGMTAIDRRELLGLACVDTRAVIERYGGRGAMLMVSAATRGLPKIVKRSAASLEVVARNCALAVGLGPRDRVLLPVLLHHSYGLEHGLLGPVFAGASVEVHAMFDVMRLMERLSDPAVTVFPAVPFVFEALAQASGGRMWGGQRLGVRRAYSAGGVLPGGVIDACRDRLGLTIGQVYGSTEIGSVTYNDPDEACFDATLAGKALRGMDIRVVDRVEPTLGRDVPIDGEGHVIVRGGSMFEGYLDSTDARVVEGYFVTGDLGVLDKRGRLRITGRAKVLIDIDGRKVNPLEVEAVLAGHPDVAEAVVLPLRVTETANRLKALIVPRAGAVPQDAALRQFTRERLSAHKVPRVFELREALPRTAAGEVDREALA